MNPKNYTLELKPTAYTYRDIIRRGGVQEIPPSVLKISRRKR